MLLSFIIPAFNVAPFLQVCVLSILSQIKPHEQIEIIIVDDGSTDDTYVVAQELLTSNSEYIRVLRQSNQGVSAARNAGIAISKGEYLVFLDADDSITPNSLSNVIHSVKTNPVDLQIWGYQKVDGLGNVFFKTNYEIFEGNIYKDLLAYYNSSGENQVHIDINRCWGMVYSATLIKKISITFPVGVPYLEDAAFLAKYFLLMENYSIHNTVFCSRLIRAGSAVNSDLFISRKALAGFSLAIIDIDTFRKNMITGASLNLDRMVHLNQTLIKFITLRLIAAINSKSKHLLLDTIKVAKKDKVQYNSRGVRYPFNLWGRSYKFSVYFFILIYYTHSRLKFLLSFVK